MSDAYRGGCSDGSIIQGRSMWRDGYGIVRTPLRPCASDFFALCPSVVLKSRPLTYASGRRKAGKDVEMAENRNSKNSSNNGKNNINAILNGSITVNGDVTINAIPATCPINDRSTFTELHSYLRSLGHMDEEKGEMKPSALKEMIPIVESGDGRCRVYDNGYALCTARNSEAEMVFWIPDCRTVRYQFDPLGAEKKYMSDYNVLIFEPERDEYGRLMDVVTDDRHQDATQTPWYYAIMETADNREDINIMNHRHGRKGEKGSEAEGDKEASKDKGTKVCHATFPDGLTLMIREIEREERKEMMKKRKEEAARRMSKLTEKQRQAYILYHYKNWKEEEIGKAMDMTQQGVSKHLTLAQKKLDKMNRFEEIRK